MIAYPESDAGHTDPESGNRFQEVFRRIEDGAVERERNRTLAFEPIEWLREAGFLKLRVPREQGGAGLPIPETFAFLISLAAADSNVPQIVRAHFAFVEEERQRAGRSDDAAATRWLERVGDGALFGAAMAELSASTSTETTLTRVDGAWRLNGRKYYSTGSLYADWIAVIAMDGEDRVRVAVPVNAPGVSRIDDWDGFGQRLTGSGTTVFENVPVEEWQIYHRNTGDDFPINRFLLAYYQTFHLATLAGIARAVLRDTIAFVRPRSRTFGVPGKTSPRTDPLVQGVVGRLSSLAFAAEALVGRVADTLGQAALFRENGKENEELSFQAELEAYHAQQVILPLVLEAATSLFEVGGASATSEKLKLDRHWRNARVLASHNPAVQRERELGDWRLNGVRPGEVWRQAILQEREDRIHALNVTPLSQNT